MEPNAPLLYPSSVWWRPAPGRLRYGPGRWSYQASGDATISKPVSPDWEHVQALEAKATAMGLPGPSYRELARLGSGFDRSCRA